MSYNHAHEVIVQKIADMLEVCPFINFKGSLVYLESFNSLCQNKGAIIFLPGGGGRLSVMASRQFFLVPPFTYGKKFWSPPLPMAKNFGPPL